MQRCDRSARSLIREVTDSEQGFPVCDREDSANPCSLKLVHGCFQCLVDGAQRIKLICFSIEHVELPGFCSIEIDHVCIHKEFDRRIPPMAITYLP